MLAIITKDLKMSQLNYEIFTQLQANQHKYKGVLIYKNLSETFMGLNFPILNYNKIFSGYLLENSTIIATDLDSAETLSRANNKANKLFYVWELEFLKNNNFERNQKIYNSLPLITRSQSYQQALENYANVRVDIMQLDLEKLWTRNTF